MENKTCRCNAFYEGESCGVFKGCPKGLDAKICDEILKSQKIDQSSYDMPESESEFRVTNELLMYIFVPMVILAGIMIIIGIVYCYQRFCRRSDAPVQVQSMQVIPGSSGSLGKLGDLANLQVGQPNNVNMIQKIPGVISNTRKIVQAISTIRRLGR